MLTCSSSHSRWDGDTHAWVTGRSQSVHPLSTVLASKKDRTLDAKESKT